MAQRLQRQYVGGRDVPQVDVVAKAQDQILLLVLERRFSHQLVQVRHAGGDILALEPSGRALPHTDDHVALELSFAWRG